MPRGFNKKDERQYEHIKEGYMDRGKDKDTAEEIAARTVNKERKEEGRTTEQRSSRSGSGSGSRSSSRSGGSEDGPTKKELYAQAQKLDIEGRSKMDKDELQRAVKRERK